MASSFEAHIPTEGGHIPRRIGLDEQIAGHSVIEKLLADREGRRPPSFLGRIFGADPLSPNDYPWVQGCSG
jgi:hypothetical protein